MAYGKVGNSPRFEVLTDAYTAHLLIDPDEYAAAERLCEGHPGGIARELGVTTALVLAWQHARHAV